MVANLHDAADVRRYVAQALCLQRVERPTPARVRGVLEWVQEIVSQGDPVPPPGFLADLGRIAYGVEPSLALKEAAPVANWPAALARSYEDYVLGKLYADWTFERAADALRRYRDRDRVKGLAYVVKQYRERANLGGVELSPGAVRTLLSVPPEELLAFGATTLAEDGPVPELIPQYEELIAATRRVAEVLGAEDILALEQRTALADLGQYVAHRQILQVTARLESQLPARPVKPLAGRKEVPTRILDEDTYPVGGYTAIANRGSVESLLHSQLAFMEPDEVVRVEGPDLFDIKFVRDELFYYSRDENQFLRRRRAFLFVWQPDLLAARYKDAELPCQRIVLVAAVVLALVRRLENWLSSDALAVELHFVMNEQAKPLAAEAELFAILFRELIERGVLRITHDASAEVVAAHAAKLARTSQVQVLLLSAEPAEFDAEDTLVTRLRVRSPRPELADARGETLRAERESAEEAWIAAAEHILQLWV